MLWIAFVVIHLVVAWSGWAMPNEPMGDVYRVYEPWSRDALTGGDVVGVDTAWVYPQLALLPMVWTQALAGPAGYIVAWAVLMTAVDAVAFAVLLGRGTSIPRQLAATFWLASIATLGPIALYRLEAFTLALAIIGCVWLRGRPLLASAVLAAATWIKVWPAAILGAALIAVRARWKVVAGAALVSVAVLAWVLMAGGGRYAFGFLTDQTSRGLQIEAPISAPFLWAAVLGQPGYSAFYNFDMLTFEVSGPGSLATSQAMTPFMVLAAVAACLVSIVHVRRGAAAISVLPTLAMTLVLILVVLNKVGSPQYITWLIAPIVLGLMWQPARWWRPAAFVLVICGLTQLVYPLLYAGVLALEPVSVAVLTLRNALLIALLVWMLARLVRGIPTPQRDAVRLDPLESR